MKKVKQYKTKDIRGKTNMSMCYRDSQRTKVVFELDRKELSLISGIDEDDGLDNISINDTLTLELNKRLHQNKDVSINENSKRKSKRYRFIVLDTDRLGMGVEPQDLNIDSNYNMIYDYDTHNISNIDENWYWVMDNDDYDKDFKDLEVKDSWGVEKK